LIGRVDLRRDFREFHSRQNGDDLEITALPKSKKAPYLQVDFVLTTDYRIKRLVVRGLDQSLMEFQFSDEQSNPALDPGLFTFQMPAGAEFVEMTGDEAGE
jgi:outer membrane lipoprotein-sorting protein